MAWLQTMCAELIAPVPAGELFTRAARGWLEGTLAEIFPDLAAALRDRPVVKAGTRPADIGGPWGEPDHVLGWVCTNRKNPVLGGREVLYSERSWARLLAALDDYPPGTWLRMERLNGKGYPLHPRGTGEAVITVRHDFVLPGWVRFTFHAPAVETGWPESAVIQDRMASFVRDQAAYMGACAGSLTDDIGPGGSTSLQRTTENLLGSVAECRQALRGYSWCTVVAAELAQRLGGAAALRAGGAFSEVSELPDGGLWLRATPTINEFTGDRVRQVFEALAPVLITGVPTFRWGESFRLVEGVDAADYQ